MDLSRREVLLGSAALLATQLAVPIKAAPAGLGGGPWRLPPKGAVQTIENEWIDLKDGTRLSARIWLPESATVTPAPVVWEYIPYRKRDFYRAHDNAWGQELAQYGIIFARVDARGSGDSEGILIDEYADQELNDGVEVIAWLARQPWSNGAVGMRGISWGGINTLQIAALAPPALKAIMPMCCTDTRYTDDAHYIGGALGFTDLQWGVQFKSVMAFPPDPAIVGDDWRALWRERLQSAPPIIAQWLEHQRNDAFWQRGSVSKHYGNLRCPVYIVDGWVDTYVNTVPRILAHVTVPRKALIGPWAHNYPESGSPGPSLRWSYEEVRWWKHWLAGEATGIMDEPMVRAYMPYKTSAEIYPKDTPGRWIAEGQWPSPRIARSKWYITESGLARSPGPKSSVTYKGDRIVGLQRLEWLPFPPEGMPGEQSPDDHKSLLFDSPPLQSDIEIFGHPVAHIRVAADQAVAKLALRLCEVTPQGQSWLVTYGLLNLTHRDGDEQPVPLIPGVAYDVVIDLSFIAHRFKAGHRIRLAVSESLWPLVWPSPTVATLTLTHGESSLELPVREDGRDPVFPIPIQRTDKAPTASRAPLQVTGPNAAGVYEIRQNPPTFSYVQPETGTTLSGAAGPIEYLSIKEGDNSSCVWQGEGVRRFQRGDWDCSVFSSFKLTSTVDAFFLEETIRASEGDVLIFERVNKTSIPRDLI